MNFYVAADYNGQVWVHINKPNNKEGWVWHSPGISIQINAKHYPKLKWPNPFQIVQKNAPELESLIQELKDKPKPPALQLPCLLKNITLGLRQNWNTISLQNFKRLKFVRR